MKSFTAQLHPPKANDQPSSSSSSSDQSGVPNSLAVVPNSQAKEPKEPKEPEAKVVDHQQVFPQPIQLHEMGELLSAVATAAVNKDKPQKTVKPAPKPVPVHDEVKKLGNRFCLANIEKPDLTEDELADL